MKTRLSFLLPALLSLPLLAQEPAPAPDSTPAPASQAELAAQAKQLDELKVIDQKQNLALEGLSEQINSQRLLLEGSKESIQNQGVLYDQCLQRLNALTNELKAALLVNAQLKEMMDNFNKSLSLSDGEAARKSEKLDAFILEFGRQSQKALALATSLTELEATVMSHQEAHKLEVAQLKRTLEQSAMNVAMILANLQELKGELETQTIVREEQTARLALEIAQCKLDMDAYKKSQAEQQDKLVASMAAGMILLFLCLVTMAFIQFTNNKRLKSAVLAGVAAKLQAASDEIRAMTKPADKPNKPAPKPRKQR